MPSSPTTQASHGIPVKPLDMSCSETVPTPSERGTSCDRDSSQSRKLQDIATEVLRLRLVLSQHRQLEGQLRAATEKLQSLSMDKVVQLRGYLEHAFRPGGGPGTLGSIHGGADPDSLLGLMECLCVVCDTKVSTRRQEELLGATRQLLKDPKHLIDKLSCLGPAPTNQSRRLAPFLLNCASAWRGQLGEAGQCYEAFRSWLSCYYQYSLASSQMQATTDQLQQQERLLEELSKDADGGTGGIGSALCRTATWRPPGVRRSSSVQSNSSTGSRHSQPPTERSLVIGLRPSPRPGGGPAVGRLSSSPRETPAMSPPKTSPRSASDRKGAQSTLSQRQAPSPSRSSSGLRPSPSRAALQRAMDKADGMPLSPRATHPGSSSPSSGTAPCSARATARGGAQPHNQSPRTGQLEKATPASRRQNVSSLRTRRSPSRDATTTAAGSRVAGSFIPKAAAQHGPPIARPLSGGGSSCAALSTPGIPEGSPQELSRSQSLQSIGEPREAGATPPLSCRGTRTDPYSASLRGSQGAPNQSAASSRNSPHTPMQQRGALSGRVHRNTPPSAGSGGTQTPSSARSAHSIQVMPMLSSRRLGNSESSVSLGHSDAGSGGTGGDLVSPGVSGACMTSRAHTLFDMRSGGRVERGTIGAPSRAQTTARTR